MMKSGRDIFTLGYDDLPATIPIFPLPGALLLPRGRMPLNIFEPRYLNMVADALATPERLIGMIMPREEERAGHPPRLFPIGCAGRITSFSETDDNRFLMTLTGLCRFQVTEEVATTRLYRRAVADFEAFRGDLAPPSPAAIDRDRLMASLKAYFGRHGLNADWDAIRNTPDEKLVTTLAMICPFDTAEKQALLECADTASRAQAMIALIEMAAHAPGGDGARH
jgi:Lon protease-like protein